MYDRGACELDEMVWRLEIRKSTIWPIKALSNTYSQRTLSGICALSVGDEVPPAGCFWPVRHLDLRNCCKRYVPRAKVDFGRRYKLFHHAEIFRLSLFFEFFSRPWQPLRGFVCLEQFARIA